MTTADKNELRKFIRVTIDSELKDVKKDIMDKKEVKEEIRATLVDLFKFLWQKSGMYIKQI